MFDWLLDRSVVWDFDVTGYQRHQQHFSEDWCANPQDKTALITGGISGIGFAAANLLVQQGCRNSTSGCRSDSVPQSKEPIPSSGSRSQTGIFPAASSDLTAAQPLPTVFSGQKKRPKRGSG